MFHIKTTQIGITYYIYNITTHTYKKQNKQIKHNDNIDSISVYSTIHKLCHTVVPHYYDTAGISKKYHYIQTIEISSTNF